MLQVASCEFFIFFPEQANYFWMISLAATLSSQALLPFCESNPSYVSAARNSLLFLCNGVPPLQQVLH